MKAVGKFFLIALVCSLSSCFDIIEDVTFEDANKGKYMLIANLSQSKMKLKTILKLDTFMGVNIPSETEIKQTIARVETAIKNTSGVSNFTKTVDFENFIFNVSFQFDKTETLNKALNNAALASSNKNKLPYWNIFSFSNNQFDRNKTPNDSLAKLAAKDKGKLSLISGANITSVYKFYTEVKSVSNSKASVSKNKKAVMLKQSIKDIILNPSLFANTIIL